MKDNTEWIKTKQEWWGLSEAGSLVNQTMNDKETYDAILPLYKLKPENPRERDSKMIREVADIGHKIKYTVPFKPETVQTFFDTRDGDCGLVIIDESGVGDKPPYSIPTLHQFMNTPFENLIEWASTPHTNLTVHTKTRWKLVILVSLGLVKVQISHRSHIMVRPNC